MENSHTDFHPISLCSFPKDYEFALAFCPDLSIEAYNHDKHFTIPLISHDDFPPFSLSPSFSPRADVSLFLIPEFNTYYLKLSPLITVQPGSSLCWR